MRPIAVGLIALATFALAGTGASMAATAPNFHLVSYGDDVWTNYDVTAPGTQSVDWPVDRPHLAQVGAVVVDQERAKGGVGAGPLRDTNHLPPRSNCGLRDVVTDEPIDAGDGEDARGGGHRSQAETLLGSRRRSWATISLTRPSKSTLRRQPSTCSALDGSPSRMSTSAGRSRAGSWRT